MGLDKWLWEDAENRCENCVVGAYRGIPYLIERDEYPRWDACADPEQVLPGAQILLGNRDDHTPNPMPDDAYWDVCSAAEELLLARQDQLFARMQENKANCKIYATLTPEEKESLDSPEIREALLEKFADRWNKDKSIDEICALFDYAGVPYKIDEMSFETSDGYTLAVLFFMKTGAALTPEIEKAYPEISERVWNYGDENVWGAETPFGGKSGYSDHDCPTLEKKCAVADYIRTAIDEGLAQLATQTPARFKLELPTAENYTNEHSWGDFNDVRFNPAETITVYCEHPMEVSRYTDSYPEGTVTVTDREKTKATPERQ